ncbi:MAG: group I truncated hemoglobin [Rhizobiaceae bacterium]
MNMFSDQVSSAILLSRQLKFDFADGKGSINMAEQALFEKYGGFSQISKVVMSFYDTLLDSDEIGPFFDDIDMSKMVDHQTKFIASLLGGPAAYSDNQLRQLHSHLDIKDSHFDELKVVLKSTLADHGIEPQDVEAVLAEFEARRKLVVG